VSRESDRLIDCQGLVRLRAEFGARGIEKLVPVDCLLSQLSIGADDDARRLFDLSAPPVQLVGERATRPARNRRCQGAER
jgi:hypothetical protein